MGRRVGRRDGKTNWIDYIKRRGTVDEAGPSRVLVKTFRPTSQMVQYSVHLVLWWRQVIRLRRSLFVSFEKKKPFPKESIGIDFQFDEFISWCVCVW